MRGFKTAALVAIAVIGSFLTACNNANENANTNSNTNTAAVNANSPAPAANANDNRRGGLTRADYDRDKAKYEREQKSSGRKIGTGVNDGWLWIKTRYDLAAADDLRDSTINVDLENGVVTLTGSVPSAQQKTRAEQVAKSVEGVTSVKNMLTVAKPSASPTATPVKKK